MTDDHAAASTQAVCRACGSDDLQDVYRVSDVPVHSCVLLDDAAAAKTFPRRNILLAYCRSCGLLQNTEFDVTALDYSLDYEDSQAHSPKFVAFAQEVAHHLVERYDLRGGHALEVGCGKGDFLAILTEVGDMTGVGFDPAFVPGPMVSAAAGHLRFVIDRYSEAYAHETADLVCCRHTLEHVDDVRELLRALLQGPSGQLGTVSFFEVPDTIRILEEGAFWDVYYEHCSYFTPGSFARLFRDSGFDVRDVRRAYDGQYLLLEASAGSSEAAHLPLEEDLDRLSALVERFRQRVPARLQILKRELDELTSAGKRLVLWGASSKAVSYLTSLDVGDEVVAVVDVNSRKRGKYLAGTGHKIVAPSELPAVAPDAVLLMNPIYASEVADMLAELEVSAQLRTLDDRRFGVSA